MRSSSLVLKAALATVAFYASHASAQEPSFFAGESTASEIDAPTTESAPPYDNEEGPQTGVDSSSTNAAPPYDGPVTSSPVTGAPPYDGSSVFSTGSVTSQTLSTVPSGKSFARLHEIMIFRRSPRSGHGPHIVCNAFG